MYRKSRRGTPVIVFVMDLANLVMAFLCAILSSYGT